MGVRIVALMCSLWLVLTFRASAPAAESDPDEQMVRTAGIATDDSVLLDFLRKRTLGSADRDKILGLIRKLGDDDFGVRERASDDLVALGVMPVALLRQATSDPDVEIARRAEGCLERIDKKQPTPGIAVSAAVARLIGKRKPAGATDVLFNYLPYADDEAVTDDLRLALAAVARTGGDPDKHLVQALHDPSPLKRGAAAEALIRSAAGQPPAAARKLMDDGDLTVRLWVALALVETRDREALPVLIDLLGQLPQERGWQAEELLIRLAGEQAPRVVLGSDEAGRQKCRDAWVEWWAANKDQVDLAKLSNRETMLGYTLVVSTNNRGGSSVLELGVDKKPRWEVPGLQFVIDAEVLPQNRILVAEYNANQVSERDLTGKVLWRHAMTNPFHCQRLPNGNTFMASRNQMLEVDRAGKAVITRNRPNQDIMAARKLRNGQIVFITTTGTCNRMGTDGNIVKSFPVGQVQTFVRFDVLPNGRVLVPQYGTSRVVEYDGDGKQVWQAQVANPTSAMRLPNGNTLVGSQTAASVLELDRSGKEVWSHRATGQVWRAWRR
jgi:hypothetical protein